MSSIAGVEMRAPRLAVFTICSNNYMPAARSLLSTVRKHHPEADLFVCLADKKISHPGLYDPDWEVIEADQLDIQDFPSFAFRYDIMEMNTAVKPFMFQLLFGIRGYDIALYFDPDIEIFQPLESILEPLRSGASLVLTPHLCSPAESEDEPNDLTIMRAGIYNLGFLGASNCPEARHIIDWWSRRLRFQCISAQEQGIFVDQKFMDLVPGFAERAHISHDTTLNVAYWNLGQRRLEVAGEHFIVDGKRLTFFHFSGFDPRKPSKLSKHAPRYDGSMAPAVKRITASYAEHLLANGYGEVPDGTYAYGKFASGTKIHPFVRDMFRRWHFSWGSNPFETYEAFLGQPFGAAASELPDLYVTNFLKYLYDRFPSLHSQFELANVDHVRQLADWYRTHAERELNIDPAIVHPELARTGPSQVVDHPPPEEVALKQERKDVTVVGYLRTASGVGEVGRQTLRTLQTGGLEVEGCDVALNVLAERDILSAAELLVDQGTAPVQIFNVNADQLPLVVTSLADRLRPDALRINMPFWELSRFPEAWLPGLELMDEIWAPSRFIAEALQSCLHTPVIYMPVALELDDPEPVPRSRFGLPHDRFLFFFAFDFLSFVERKNPAAVVEAFRKAFPDRGGASLVIKCMNGERAPEGLATFRQLLAGDPDIILIDETLSRSDTLALIACSDAVVSLHRSEGLGLLIGEAMLLKKPVIATDYSATQDLLSADTGYPVSYRLVPVPEGAYPFAEGQVWADPDIAHAARLMRGVFDDPSRSVPGVQRAYAQMISVFSSAAVGRLQADRIRRLTSGVTSNKRQVSKVLPDA